MYLHKIASKSSVWLGKKTNHARKHLIDDCQYVANMSLLTLWFVFVVCGEASSLYMC